MAKVASHKAFRALAGLITLEGAFALTALLVIPADATNGLLLGYSTNRLLMAAAITVATLIAGFFYLRLKTDRPLAQRLQKIINWQAAFPLLLAASLAGMAICLNWRFADARWQASLLRAFPLLLFVSLALTQTLVLLLLGKDQDKQRRLTLVAFALLLATFYLNAAFHYSVVNREYWLSDQEAYLQFARAVHEHGFPYTGDRAFMPLYPYTLATFLDFRQALPPLYAQAKAINIFLSVGLLGTIFLVLRRYFKLYVSSLLAAIVAFTLFIYKAAYTQPELLFYTLFFFSFLALLSLLQRPRWGMAVVAGVLLAAAHLTKASVLPLVGLFVVFAGIRVIRERMTGSAWNVVLQYIATFALTGLVFLGLLAPYLLESKERFGQYFYNVNSTFYIWYDSWGEVLEGTRAHGDSVAWPDVPADQIPSMGSYLAKHSFTEILQRFGRGLAVQARNLTFTFAAASFPLLASFGLALTANDDKKRAKALVQDYAIPAAFTISLFAGYILLFAWYSPIADYADQRFVYGLYVPILFVAFFVMEKLRQTQKKNGGSIWPVRAYTLMAIILVADMLLRLPIQLSVFHWYGK